MEILKIIALDGQIIINIILHNSNLSGGTSHVVLIIRQARYYIDSYGIYGREKEGLILINKILLFFPAKRQIYYFTVFIYLHWDYKNVAIIATHILLVTNFLSRSDCDTWLPASMMSHPSCNVARTLDDDSTEQSYRIATDQPFLANGL